MDETTKFILRLIMIVYLSMGFGIIFSPGYYRKAFEKMFDNKGVTYLGGLMTLVAGFAIISYHNVWRGWAALVTLLGWVAFLKGLMVLVLPEKLMKFSNNFVKKSYFYVYGIIAIILGLVFGYFGYLV